MARDIFKNHYGVIHNHTENEDQGKKGQAVYGKVKTPHKDKGDGKGDWDADGGKDGISYAYGEPKDEENGD